MSLLRRLSASVAIAALACLAPRPRLIAQTRPDPCTTTSNPPDATLATSTRDGQATFREGEIVELTLAFTSSVPGKYQASTRNYDRSGRLGSEVFCVEPSAGGRDPIADYFSGIDGYVGGGAGGYQPVTSVAYQVAVELNEWKALAPGTYHLRVVSHRLERAAAKGESGTGPIGVPIISNPITVEIAPATPEWQAAQLATAITAFDSPVAATARHGARMLRFLGSEASTRELARRYWTLNDQPNGWDLMFGLVGSPHRQIAIDSMKAAIVEPSHPISLSFIGTLTLLEMQASNDYVLPAFDPAKRDEWSQLLQRRRAAREERIAQHQSELTAAIDIKTASARASSVEALLTARGTIAVDRAKLRQMLIASWDTLPLRTRNELLLSRWDQIGGPDWLPLLRSIVNGPASIPRRIDQVDRGTALMRIYQLAPDEGRTLIMREITDVKGDIDISVLGLLPDRELPAVEPQLIARLQSDRGSPEVDYQLLSRYASVRALADVQRVYEPRRGRWECAPQTAMLRYFLRVAPEYGAGEVKTALAARAPTGCYQFVLTDLKDALARPEIEIIAIAALEDPSPRVVGNAAEALGRYGSAAAEDPLWRRLTEFHEVWKDHADELRVGPGLVSSHAADGMVEYSIKEALSRGQGWICGPEKLARLKALLTPMRQGEIDSRLNEWQGTPFPLSMFWPGDGGFRYVAGPYMGDSFDALLRKVKQFPAGTHFVCVMSADVQTQHRAEIDAVKAAAQAAGLMLEIKAAG